MSNVEIVSAVADVYKWIDQTMAGKSPDCKGCGNCCDFKRYDHRLYITSVELEYFKHFMADRLRPMTDGICPYRNDNKCTVHTHRFAGCRIFNCRGTENIQADISEQAIEKLKAICQTHDTPYTYTELSKALRNCV